MKLSLQVRSSCLCTALAAAVIKAERTRAERDDLEQSAGHHHVLEEVDHLVLVGKITVECDRGRKRKHGERACSDAGLETGDEQKAATQLDENGDRESQLRQR